MIVIPYNGGSGVGIEFIGARLCTYRMAQSRMGRRRTEFWIDISRRRTTQLFRYNINGNQMR